MPSTDVELLSQRLRSFAAYNAEQYIGYKMLEADVSI
jgi:hypothetical protein